MSHSVQNAEWIKNPNTNRMVKVGSKTYKILLNANAIEKPPESDEMLRIRRDSSIVYDDESSYLSEDDIETGEDALTTDLDEDEETEENENKNEDEHEPKKKFKANKSQPERPPMDSFDQLIRYGGAIDKIDEMNDKELGRFFDYINAYKYPR